MNVIPKLLQGGGIESFFTIYQPVKTPSNLARSSYKEEKKQSKDDDEEKGKLTLKDFFNMIKDIDGLPNEMRAITNSLMNTFQMTSLAGRDINNLTTTYLLALYLMKIAQENKAVYKKAVENALKNGAMNEPAITPDGKLLVQTDTGSLSKIDLNTYFDNKDKYHPLTISNVAHLRAYDSEFNYDQSSFDVINNGIGFESFLKLVETATINLGSISHTRNGYFSAEGLASKGLELLQTLSKDDRVQAMGSVTAEGLYEYKIIDKNLLNQIKALTSYILTLFPDNAKTWAAWKLQTPNKNKATLDLIFRYLMSGNTSSHEFNINYQGTMDHAMGKNGSSKEKDPQEGFWRQVQSGKGGVDTSYNMIIDNGSMILTGGKYYGMTPGPEENCSLGDYITKSGLGYLKNSSDGITFGNIELSSDSLDDVVVNTHAGAYAVTIPVKNGKPWLEALEVYNSFRKELKKSGFNPGTVLYASKINELLKNPEYVSLSNLIQNDGELNPNNSMHYLVLEGVTSSKAYGMLGSEKQSLSEFDSNFIVLSKDDELREMLEKALSSKEKGDYKTDNNWVWWNNDKIYKGNIYIPLNTNPMNAMNADSNNITTSTARNYEQMQLEWNKENSMLSTNSNVI